jgi:hypothetical protein
VVHHVHIHPGSLDTGFLGRACHGCLHSFNGSSRCKACQEDLQPGGLLDDLPPVGSGFIEDVVEHDRMSVHPAFLGW